MGTPTGALRHLPGGEAYTQSPILVCLCIFLPYFTYITIGLVHLKGFTTRPSCVIMNVEIKKL